jgi:hypothetical protein
MIVMLGDLFMLAFILTMGVIVDGAEAALIVEIVTSAPDALQRIVDLAGDLRVAGKQISVLVTRQTVDTFEVTA